MDELRQTSPELVEQIHVFSSFFYNKLTSVPKK
jgi:Ulp1 family protease